MAVRALEQTGLAGGGLVVCSMRGHAAVHPGDQATAEELAQLAEHFAVAQDVRDLYAEAAWMWLGAGQIERAIALASTLDVTATAPA